MFPDLCSLMRGLISRRSFATSVAPGSKGKVALLYSGEKSIFFRFVYFHNFVVNRRPGHVCHLEMADQPRIRRRRILRKLGPSIFFFSHFFLFVCCFDHVTMSE
jgi:hypothetical protein